MDATYLILLSVFFCFANNLVRGSSKLVLTPLINYFLGSEVVTPAIAIESSFSSLQKLLRSWQAINWHIIRWYLPGAAIGTLLSAYVFASNNLEKLLLGVVFSIGLKYMSQHISIHSWYFLLAGFTYPFISKLLINTGFSLDSIYINYGLTQEQAIATKAANTLSINIPKMCIYTLGGAITQKYLLYGIAIAIAAVPANLLAQLTLKKLDDKPCKYLVNSSIAASSVLMLSQQNYCQLGKLLMQIGLFIGDAIENFPSLSPLIA